MTNERMACVYAVGIDIGHENMGISCGLYSIDHKLINIYYTSKISLASICSSVHHKTVSFKECKLYHTNNYCDKIDHFCQYYQEHLNRANRIYIEYQVPESTNKVLEQLIMIKYRDFSKLIHPSTMHSLFGIKHLDYDGRKSHLENMTKRYMTQDCKLLFDQHKRQHDMADGAAIMMCGMEKDKPPQQYNPKYIQLSDGSYTVSPFSSFIYKGSVGITKQRKMVKITKLNCSPYFSGKKQHS
jgi:hypothetical protein